MRALVCAALIVAGIGAAGAQEPAPAGDPPAAESPLLLRVQPSSIDDPAAAVRAQEALLQRRLAEADYLFRNICVQCGGGINRPGAYAPFNPIESLNTRRR